MQKIRLVLIEDNDVFREALQLLLGLRPELEIVGAEPDGSHAVEICKQLAPDVLLIDYRLPGADGVQITRAVHAECPKIAVVCLTASANAREVEALYAAGAVDCLMKDASLDAIVAAIERAADSRKAGAAAE